MADRGAGDPDLTWTYSILFITGAGVSADSGLPTYRGIGGLYEDAVTDEGLSIEEALSGETLRRDPALTWKYIHQIEKACRGARPNRAHEVIAAIERRVPRTVVLTQNVDGFHVVAGSTRVIEIHGNVHQLRCRSCPWSTHVDDYAALEVPPRCPECGTIVRPEVVLFGEMLPPLAVQRLERELDEGFDVIFTIGTTSVFPYIAAPVALGRRSGTPTIEINPGASQVTHLVTLRLQSRAAPTLDALWSMLAARWGV